MLYNCGERYMTMAWLPGGCGRPVGGPTCVVIKNYGTPQYVCFDCFASIELHMKELAVKYLVEVDGLSMTMRFMSQEALWK